MIAERQITSVSTSSTASSVTSPDSTTTTNTSASSSAVPSTATVSESSGNSSRTNESGTTHVISTTILYTATWPPGVTTGGTFQGSLNLTYSEGSLTSSTTVVYVATAPIGGSVSGTFPGQINTTLPVLFQSTPALSSVTSTSDSTTTPQNPSTATPKKSSESKGISPSAAAGIAIGTFVIGALLAVAVASIMWQKRKSKYRRPRNDGGFRSQSARETTNEKSGFKNGPAVEINDFDYDRLFPQPLDDAAVKSEAHNLFSQIDAHVESFYNDAMDDSVNAKLQNGIPQTLLDPQTRLFMIKKIITQAMLESTNERCVPDRAFLPFNFTDVARRLQDVNLNDHGEFGKRIARSRSNHVKQTPSPGQG